MVDALKLETREELRHRPDWERLRRQIYSRALRFADNVVFDFRDILTEASNAELAGRLMWQLIKPFSPGVLVGPGFGAAPLLYATAFAALGDGVTLNILMVRDKRKGHHQKKWVEGRRQPPSSRAVIVDDFMEGGSAVPLVEEALKADGHELDIRAAAIFFDMWQPLGSRQIAMAKFPVVSVFKRHDIGLSRDCFDARPPSMKGSYPDFLQERLWWRFDLNEKSEYPYKSVPVIADGAVFAADDRCRVWRHAAQDGAIEWRYESLTDAPKGIVQRLQYADRSLVFGCYDGTVTRLRAENGEVLWRWRQDSSIHATPEIDLARNRLFINTEQWNDGAPFGHLYALDWTSGRVLWTYSHRYWSPGSAAYDEAANAVVATCNDQTVVCVDAGSGERRWQVLSNGLVRGRPAIAGGRVYLATEKGHLQCLHLGTGETVWTTRCGNGGHHQFVLAQDGCVFAFDGRWHMTAFDARTGAIRWLNRMRSAGCWCPVPCGRYLVVLSKEGHLAVFDPSREVKVWEGAVGGRYAQPPAIGSGLLAVASNNQGLKVFRINPFYHQ